MSWEQRLLWRAHEGQDLLPLVDQLLAQQRETWPLLRAGEAALDQLRTRQLERDGAHLVVQANPGRIGSSSAAVDAASVAQRPCFLCEPNLPPEERGVAFGDEIVLVPNPYPIVRRHLSVPSRTSMPQAIAGRAALVVALTRGLGPDMLVLYNGPRCGASAPDHFHLQAGSARGMPVAEDARCVGVAAEVTPLELFGRRLLLLRSEDPARSAALLERAVRALNELCAEDDEPMLNLVATHRDGLDELYLFPRARHRPDCFYAEGDARLMVSPGALDLAGWLVVAEPEHFDKVNADTAYDIFAQVTLDAARFERLVEAMT